MEVSLFKRPRPNQVRTIARGDVAELLHAPVFHDLAPETLVRTTAILGRLGLPRLLRLMVAGSIPPLWYEIAILHYRGSFQSRWMWLPLAYLPLEMVGGILAGANDTPTTRRLFRALSC